MRFIVHLMIQYWHGGRKTSVGFLVGMLTSSVVNAPDFVHVGREIRKALFTLKKNTLLTVNVS